METTKVCDKYSVLCDYFSTQLGWHRARIKFFVLLIIALCKLQTVCFEQLAAGIDSPAQISSSLRRIQRFFAAFTIDKDPIARLLFSWLPRQSNLIISIDRTNWQFGKTDINIFMLSVCYDGIAFPLLWKLLAKKGNTNTKERTDILDKFVKLFGKGCIKAVVADREFIGKDWLKYLQQQRISFHIRVRDNMWFEKPGGEKLRISWVLQGLKLKEAWHHPKLLYLDRVLVYVSGMKLEGGEYLLIVSYDHQQQALSAYRQRWQIETMFKAFKTNGFNIENTHLRDTVRIDKLVVVVSIAFTWAYKIGIYVHEHVKPIAIKAHHRKAHSFFKYGFRYIINALLVNHDQLIIFSKLLSGT